MQQNELLSSNTSRKMDINTLHSDAVKMGQVFTPVEWAEWLIKKWDIYDAWIRGASVCDPTAGKGAFALAMLRLARANRVEITQDFLSRLTLIEIQSSLLEEFKWQVNAEFGIDFPSQQLLVRDVIKNPPDTQYDILVGNPPWANFADLPEGYKEDLKSYFIAEGLVPDRQRALLGCSRTDLAALVLKVVLGTLLRRNGFGCFFVPLSLFFGDDAHRGFRDYSANHRKFAIEDVYEFTETKVFTGIGTSYCCARFKIDCMQQFPVKYFRQSRNKWVEHRAFPLSMPQDPWIVLTEDTCSSFSEVIDITLLPMQKPRQGVNTCGANQVFIFTEKPSDLPDQFIYPLATTDIWKKGDIRPNKWILLPYNANTGKPLTWYEIEQFPGLRRHLMTYKDILEKRKGTLIRSMISKGIYWSLLGVGPYSFAPYKVIWESYGKSHFQPVVLHTYAGQVWQANQAMQAFIPCWDLYDAKRICDALKHNHIQSLLQQLNGKGKCNWAQPGKIKKIMSFGKQRYNQSNLFDCV